MRISWQSFINAIAAIYKTFFKGKTVNVGGQQVTLPNQDHTPPLRGSKFDSAPHKMEPPSVRGGRP